MYKSNAGGAPVLNIAARYDAASQGRRLAKWRPPSSGPNAAVTPAAGTVRDRARDAARNDPIAASIVRAWASALVGSGIVGRSTITDATRKAKINSVWERWQEESDFSGTQDFYGLQALVATAMVRDGECFVRIRFAHPEEGLFVPIQLELMEADLCPLNYNADLPNGNRIRAGVELNARGKRVAYWMHKEHPGEMNTLNGANLLRIPADEIAHVFLPERPGQLRGVSWLAPILVQLRNLADYQDATLERVKLQNLYAGIITRPEPAAGMENIDPLTGLVVQNDASGVPMVSLEPGGMLELAPGENIEFSSPPDTGPNYREFNRVQTANAAAAVGLPYELVSGDVLDMGDRALRVVINEFRRLVEARQFATIIPQLCRPVRRSVMEAAALAGRLRPTEAGQGIPCEWTPPRFKYLHPVQDVAALKAEVDAGFRSRASVIAEMGYDAADVDAERAADQQREKSLGIQIAAIGSKA